MEIDEFVESLFIFFENIEIILLVLDVYELVIKF